MDTVSRFDYEVHPLAKLFPELPAKEFEELKADIRKHGQLDPIIISREKLLLDGRNRLKVCEELRITPRTRFLADVPNIGGMTEAEFIWSRNVLRRHLTEDQRLAIATHWIEEIEKAAKSRQLAVLKKGSTSPVWVKSPKRESTRETVAKMAKSSSHKAKQILTVAKRKPELLPKIKSGEVKLKDAAASVANVQLKVRHHKHNYGAVTYHHAEVAAAAPDLAIVDPKNSGVVPERLDRIDLLVQESFRSESVNVLDYKRYANYGKGCCKKGSTRTLADFAAALAIVLDPFGPLTDYSGKTLTFQPWADGLHIVRIKKAVAPGAAPAAEPVERANTELQ